MDTPERLTKIGLAAERDNDSWFLSEFYWIYWHAVNFDAINDSAARTVSGNLSLLSIRISNNYPHKSYSSWKNLHGKTFMKIQYSKICCKITNIIFYYKKIWRTVFQAYLTGS